jgi:hypothetical protein
MTRANDSKPAIMYTVANPVDSAYDSTSIVRMLVYPAEFPGLFPIHGPMPQFRLIWEAMREMTTRTNQASNSPVDIHQPADHQ